jgi:hypothetical protein
LPTLNLTRNVIARVAATLAPGRGCLGTDEIRESRNFVSETARSYAGHG